MSLTGIASVFFAFIVSLPAQDSISQEYEKEVIHQEKFDKDLSTTDPNDPEDIFTNKERGGIFKNYHSLKLYYVGYGANKNTTTRFRRYAGGGDRPVLPEHDLKEEKFLNQANQTIKIQILSDGDKNQFYRNGELVFSFKDELPYTQGWFGFRTVRNHLQLDNFKVYEVNRSYCDSLLLIIASSLRIRSCLSASIFSLNSFILRLYASTRVSLLTG